HIDREMAAVRSFQPLPPMRETETCSIPRSVEPALITAENFALDCGGIYVRARWTGVRQKPGFVRGLGRPAMREQEAGPDSHQPNTDTVQQDSLLRKTKLSSVAAN